MLPGKQYYTILKNFESCSLIPYLDGGGIATIGWGNTFYPDGKAVTMHDKPLSRAMCDNMLTIMSEKLARQLTPLLPQNITQNRFDAILDFCWNEGIGGKVKGKGFKDSTLHEKILANMEDPTIWGELLLWDKDNKKPVLGLYRRRQSEGFLYFKNEINLYPNLQFNNA